MSRGELFGIIGLTGMVLSVLCLESAMLPAVITFGICSIVCFAGQLIGDGGFIKDTTSEDRIRQNRERLWRSWMESEVKKKK